MSCKAHPHFAGVGVCAPCLRNRLLSFQNQQPSSDPPSPASPPAPPLHFPRSVSPYACRRPSDASPALRLHPNLLLFCTPQVGPSFAFSGDAVASDLHKRGSGKLPLLARLFRHSRSEKVRGSDEARSAGSWFSDLFRVGRRRRAPDFRTPASGLTGGSMPSRRRRDRGLSPEERKVPDGDSDHSPPPESPWRPTPSPMRRAPFQRRHSAGRTGFTVCLSPLVRPSPAHRRSHVADGGFSGDTCAAAGKSSRHFRHASSGASSQSLGPNRSRKLADLGRFQ